MIMDLMGGVNVQLDVKNWQLLFQSCDIQGHIYEHTTQQNLKVTEDSEEQDVINTRMNLCENDLTQ